MPGQMSRHKRFLLRREAQLQARYRFLGETERIIKQQQAIPRTYIHTKTYGIYAKPNQDGILTRIPLVGTYQRILKHAPAGSRI